MTTTDRPLATFALFAYNQEKYIREAVEGAFAQTYEPLEIILSDDCSSDRTFEIMQEMAEKYKGLRKRVVVRQNISNLGLAGHVNVITAMAGGEYIVFASGDDISLPQRVSETVEIFARHPKVWSITFSAHDINQDGELLRTRRSVDRFRKAEIHDLQSLLRWRVPFIGAARSIRKAVYDIFGPLSDDCPTEDTTYLLRSLMCGAHIASRKVMVRYRVHASNLSGENRRNEIAQEKIERQYLKDIKRARDQDIISGLRHDELVAWVEKSGFAKALRKKSSPGYRVSISELRSMRGMFGYSYARLALILTRSKLNRRNRA